MGFNTEVFVKFKKKDTSPCPAMAPLKGIRAAMLLEIKTFFSKPLEPEYDPARDLAEALWFSLPPSTTFKPNTVMVKVKNYDDKEENVFKFTVVLLKRPQLYPNSTDAFFSMWSEPESRVA